jgi:hypothetical protein
VTKLDSDLFLMTNLAINPDPDVLKSRNRIRSKIMRNSHCNENNVTLKLKFHF